MIKGDADHRAEVVQLPALLWITGDVHLALWRTMTGEAGFHVILWYSAPECRPPVVFDLSRKWLASRPSRIEQPLLDDIGLPRVGARLAVADELHGRGDLDLGFTFRQMDKAFGDQPRKDRRDEAFERGSFLVDRRLIVVDALAERRHHRSQQARLA